MKAVTAFVTIAILLGSGCQLLPADPEPANLSGRWIGMNYQCPLGTYHNEVIDITQAGNEISAVKVTGDDCVLAGSKTFSGNFDAGSNSGNITWVTGYPTNPSSSSGYGDIKLEGCTLKANSNTTEEIVFARIDDKNSVSYDLPVSVPLIPQPNKQTCWAAAATMMWSYRDNQVLSISYAFCVKYFFSVDYCLKFSNSTDNQGGLAENEVNELFSQMGLKKVEFSPSIQGIKELLEANGPLLVIKGNNNGQHARIVTGIHGDGTPGCTYLNITDPWLPNEGKIYVESYQDFIKEIEELVGTTNIIPIYHW